MLLGERLPEVREGKVEEKRSRNSQRLLQLMRQLTGASQWLSDEPLRPTHFSSADCGICGNFWEFPEKCSSFGKGFEKFYFGTSGWAQSFPMAASQILSRSYLPGRLEASSAPSNCSIPGLHPMAALFLIEPWLGSSFLVCVYLVRFIVGHCTPISAFLK